MADVKLLVSELITNSVKYGGRGDVVLNVEAPDARQVRLEVVDPGVGFVLVARNRPATEVGGWGLHLVQTLANRWASARARRTVVRDRPPPRPTAGRPCCDAALTRLSSGARRA
jgi:anti-sigma regulatory factor (Ser/Thr protein kinase)